MLINPRNIGFGASSSELTEALIRIALEAGVDLIGAVATDAVLSCDQEISIQNLMPDVRSILVLGIRIQDPVMDIWSYPDPGNSPLCWSIADQVLGRVAGRIALFLERQGFPSEVLSYSRIRLKEAAMEAGLGVIGRNNLLITPEYGPRIRLRALMTTAELPVGERSHFDPCECCLMPCIRACPAHAFVNGDYLRDRCYQYARSNLEKVGSQSYRWCRECELACSLGQDMQERTPPIPVDLR